MNRAPVCDADVWLVSQGKSTGVSDCYVAIYLDGALLCSAQMADAGASPPDATRMGVTDLAGIEFYADGISAPAGMHSSDGGCGNLWLWTRQKQRCIGRRRTGETPSTDGVWPAARSTSLMRSPRA